MLSRALTLAAHPTRLRLRTLATSPFPDSNSGRLNTLLGEERTPIWGHTVEVTDPNLKHPPIGPAGTLPPGSSVSEDHALSASRKKSSVSEDHALPEPRPFHLHVFASRNNTILTLTNALHQPRHWVSAGSCGFKKVQRSGYEAGYQCAVRMFKYIERVMDSAPGPVCLSIAFKGFGFGREATLRAIMATEGDRVRETIFQLKDTTPIKIGGTKARKARRL